MKKFSFKDFVELDTKSLLKVNGGSCGSISGSSSSNSSGGGGGQGPSSASGNPSGASGGSGNSSGSGGGGSDSKKSNGGNGNIFTGYRYGDSPKTSKTNTGQKSNATESVSSGKTESGKSSTETVSISLGGSAFYDGGTKSSGKGSSGSSCNQSGSNGGGHGSSVTSSNPGGSTGTGNGAGISVGQNSAGGTCGGKSSQSNTVNLNPGDIGKIGTDKQSELDVPSAVEKPEASSKLPSSGKFAQITDGTYQDMLTMQYYKDENNLDIIPQVLDPSVIKDWFDREMNGDMRFSEKGCLITAVTKIISELTGKKTLRDVNDIIDVSPADGLLSNREIQNAINYYLDNAFGDIFDVKSTDTRNSELSLNDIETASTQGNGTTFVLGHSSDCYGGHWVVLEGYNTNENGVITFNYDGTSINDDGRTYVYGKDNFNESKKTFTIDRIQTYTIYKK